MDQAIPSIPNLVVVAQRWGLETINPVTCAFQGRWEVRQVQADSLHLVLWPMVLQPWTRSCLCMDCAAIIPLRASFRPMRLQGMAITSAPTLQTWLPRRGFLQTNASI